MLIDEFLQYSLNIFGFQCDRILQEKARTKDFEIAARLLFESFLLIFVALQTVWFHCINMYELKPKSFWQRFFFTFAFVHVIVVNLIIYMKSTLDEANEKFEEEKHARGQNGTNSEHGGEGGGEGGDNHGENVEI